MIRIDERTVELTWEEQVASENFDDLLDLGYPTPGAIDKLKAQFPLLSQDFFDWLAH